MTLIELARFLWHKWHHDAVNDCMIERAPGEVYLRCRRCGLRSVASWKTGPLKIRSRLPGDPARFRLDDPALEEFVAVTRSDATLVLGATELEARTGKLTIH